MLSRAVRRNADRNFADLDRIVHGTSIGVAMAFDRKHRVARQWASLRSKHLRRSEQAKGLSGAALEAAVMALKAADSSLVKIEAAGAQ